MILGNGFKRATAWLLAGVAVLSAAASEAAGVDASIQSVSAPSGTKAAPLYVIDSDAESGGVGYNRDTFDGSVQVNFTLASGYASGSDSFRVAVQLVDEQGNAVDLAGTTGKTAYSATQTISLDGATPASSAIFNVPTIDPDQDLGAGGSYHLVARVQKWSSGTFQGHPFYYWGNVDGPDDSSPFVVVHFTGPNASDLAVNVRGYTMGSASWGRSYKVATDPDKDEFSVSVPYRLMRYDIGESWHSSWIGIRLDVDLFDETGAEVPLVGDGKSSTSVSMFSYNFGLVGISPASPRVAAGDFSVSFRPTAQLDSVHHRYRATVNVKHVEFFGIPTSTVLDDGTEDTSLRRLLDFNGNLHFGSLVTVMHSVLNDPVITGVSADYVTSQVKVDGRSGEIPPRPDLAYGTDALLSVRVYPDGHAEVYSGEESVTTRSGGSVVSEFGHVKVTYSQTRIDRNGPRAAGASVRLPQGLAYTPDYATCGNRFERKIEFGGGLALDNTFRHTAKLSMVPPAGAAFFDEARPLVYGKLGEIAFSTAGRISTAADQVLYCHGAAFDQLETDRIHGYHEDASMAERMTNDGYLRWLEIPSGTPLIIKAAADGSARLDSGVIGVRSGQFTAHFPVGTEISWTDSGEISFKDGGVSDGSHLEKVNGIKIPFDGSCPDDICATGGSAETSISFAPEDEALVFSRDGSLHAPGDVEATQLQWGLRSDGHGGFGYSHRTDEFRQGVFEMAGQFGYAAENPGLASGSPWQDVAADLSPGGVLFAGADPADVGHMIYPGTTDYTAGAGFYAGCNFVAQDSMGGASRIGGATDDYAYALLDDVSKYYVRRGGLSGRHAPKDGSYAGELEIYGYNFEVTLFQLTFLSNLNVDSWFNGAVHVEEPAGFTQAFKGMTLTCTGDLDQAEIDPDDPGPKPLVYWNGEFTPHAIRFSEIGTASGCYPERALVIGLSTEVAHVNGALCGNLAFTNKGNIAPPSMDVEGAPGRLGMPASIRLDGPGEEEWTLSPCTGLYFNNPDIGPGDVGFVTFAATMGAPWFEDIEVQMLTSASSGGSASVYLTGGWTAGGETLFTNANFDADNAGYPGESTVSLATYKSLPTGSDYTDGSDIYFDYRVKARQSLFGLIDLVYPLEWSVTARYFKSTYPMTDNLVVIKDLFHQVDYMSPNRLDVSFGAKYEGMPRINLAGAAFDAVDEQLGIARALTESASQMVSDTLSEGADELDRLASDTLEDLIDQMLDKIGVDVFDPLYGRLSETYHDAWRANKTLDQWRTTMNSEFDKYFDPAGGASESLRNRLDKLADQTNKALSMVARAQSAVDKGIVAIDAVSGQIKTIQEGGVEVPVYKVPHGGTLVGTYDGLLRKDGSGQRDYIQKLVKYLITQLASPEIADAVNAILADQTRDLNEKLNELLEDANPTLDQLVDVLQDLRGYLVQVHEALDSGGEMLTSFQQIVTQASGELSTITMQVGTAAHDYIDQFFIQAQMVGTSSLKQYDDIFNDFSEESFRTLLADELRDLLLQSGVYQQFQYVLRQWTADLDEAMHNAIDSVFAEIQNLVKEVIQEALGPIDDAINGVLGGIGKYLGAGSIQGSAQFNGDSLKRLRLDGEFQFKIPDDMELHAYLEILQYTSEDDFAASGCLQPGEKALEVRLGATDVGLDWLSPDMRVDIGVKLSMDTTSGVKPKGIGGSFEMTGGSLNFEAFKITELGASIGVGTDECYLAAQARMIFSSYELAGGIFFGRTCTIEPLEMIDKDVADLLGPAPFTGAYVYGEVWLPISEIVLGVPASCMFEISAGVGAGAFYFVEGPTWGGQMLLGVSGEVLCVVSIKGQVKMIGVMAGNSLRFSGRGSLSGKAGVCPFCIKFSKSAKIGYQEGDWSVDL